MAQPLSIENWEHFFKPEVRSAGQTFVSKGKVTLMHPSDTELQAYVRAASSLKVQFKTPSMDSPLLIATCNCPQSKKRQFCKHIWATLVVAHEKNPDFFESKTDIETIPHDTPTAADLYRAKQKERAQQFKKTKTAKPPTPISHPSDVEEALSYFKANGFDLNDSLKPEDVGLARKKLARVFHPDRGGSHEEITDLNKFTEILLEYSEID